MATRRHRLSGAAALSLTAVAAAAGAQPAAAAHTVDPHIVTVPAPPPAPFADPLLPAFDDAFHKQVNEEGVGRASGDVIIDFKEVD